MIRKILKWVGIVLGGLIGLLLLALVVLYSVGTLNWNRVHGTWDVPVETVAIPTGNAAVARGEHIATIRICKSCHTENLSGQSEAAPPMFTLSVPNLTPGKGGVGSTNKDSDWVRAIRHGVGHDGRGLALMPSRVFYYLSDEDLGDLIAYLKSLPPVDHQMPPTDLGPLGRVMLALGLLPADLIPNVTVIDHSASRPVAPQRGVSVEYGKYLAHVCTLCHGANLNGRTLEGGPGVIKVALNLTPGGEVGQWSEEVFRQTLRTGVTPSGRKLDELMPFKYFSQMTDDELKALWMYLRSLPALPQGK